jgi:hypothetical protein
VDDSCSPASACAGNTPASNVATFENFVPENNSYVLMTTTSNFVSPEQTSPWVLKYVGGP